MEVPQNEGIKSAVEFNSETIVQQIRDQSGTLKEFTELDELLGWKMNVQTVKARVATALEQFKKHEADARNTRNEVFYTSRAELQQILRRIEHFESQFKVFNSQ